MKGKNASYCKWLQRVAIWIKADCKSSVIIIARVAVGVLASFVISLRAVNFYPKNFSWIGLSGILLHIFGTIVVGLMISKRRKLFGLPTFMENMKRFPKLQQSPAIIKSGSSAAQITSRAFGKGYASVTPPPGASAEERINALEVNLARQTKKIDDMERECKQEESSIREDISILITRERTERESDINSIESTIKEFAVGDIGWETVGLYWLFIGSLLGILGMLGI